MTDTTPHEGSILEPKTDVEHDSQEQRVEKKDDDSNNDVKGYSKFVTKTSQTLSKLDQSYKDTAKLNAYLLKKYTPEQIKEKDPELAERLSSQEEYSELFIESEKKTEVVKSSDSEQLIKSAVSDLVIDGKRLNLADRKILRENKTFNKHVKAFIGAGFEPEEAAYKAFKEAYPSKANMVDTSFLSVNSEPTSFKKESSEEKWEKRFSKSKIPPYLKKYREQKK